MTEKVKRNIRKYFGLFTSIWTGIVAIALIIQVWRVYGLQDRSFTIERIATHFNEIAALVYIWLAAVIVSGVLAYVIPAPQEKIIPYVELRYTLVRLEKRLGNTSAQRVQQSAKRTVAYWVCGVVALISSVVALVYMLAEYPMLATKGFLAQHEETERVLRALVWVVAGLGVSIAVAYYKDATYIKEIALAKEEIAENAKKGVKVVQPQEKTTFGGVLQKVFSFTGNKWFVFGLRVAVAVLAVAFIFIGTDNGGMKAVLEKAINICTQCIGIG